MAEGNGALYNKFKERLLAGEIALVSHDIKIALVTGYTPDIDTDFDWADISALEESGDGYSAGGSSLASKAIDFASGTDTAAYDATDHTFTGLDVGTPSHLVAYDDDHASDALIGYWELGRASNGGDYGLTWNASGLITLT